MVDGEQTHELEANVREAAEEEDVHLRTRRLEKELLLPVPSVWIIRRRWPGFSSSSGKGFVVSLLFLLD